MFYKRLYIVMAVFLALSGSILAWIAFYGDFSHHSPVRAKQVFHSKEKQYLLQENDEKNQYNMAHNVQTIIESI